MCDVVTQPPPLTIVSLTFHTCSSYRPAAQVRDHEAPRPTPSTRCPTRTSGTTTRKSPASCLFSTTAPWSAFERSKTFDALRAHRCEARRSCFGDHTFDGESITKEVFERKFPKFLLLFSPLATFPASPPTALNCSTSKD